MRPAKIRFEEKFTTIPETDCWWWTASANQKGYGTFRVAGKTLLAHRFGYDMYVGEIPEGMCVLHRCDNPACVNPDHLFLGTNADNVRDKMKKKRHRSSPGSKNGFSKLTEEDVLAIRASNEGSAAIAKKYGIAQAYVYRLRNRDVWTHL